MQVPRIITSFRKYTDANFEVKAQTILSSMTDNENFPEPNPSLETVSIAISDYSELLVRAKERGRTDVALKNDARKELEATLRTLGAYVTMVGEGNRTIYVSSGYDLVKEPEPTPPITTPQNLQIKSGLNSGEMQITVDSQLPAKSYEFGYTDDPLTETSTWITETVTETKYLFKGLQRGKNYLVRVAAIGVRQQKVYSQTVSFTVQ